MDLLVKPSARNQLRELCMVHSSEYALIYRPGDRVLSWSIEKNRYVASSIVVTACAQGLTVRHRWKKGQSFFLSPTAHHRIWIHSGQQFRLVHLVPKLQFKPGDRLRVTSEDNTSYVAVAVVVSVSDQELIVKHEFGNRGPFRLTPTEHSHIWAAHEGDRYCLTPSTKKTHGGTTVAAVPPSRSAPSVETQSSVEAL